MYRALIKKIQELEMSIESAQPEMKNNIKKSLDMYILEKEKIRKMFPDKFFENLENYE